MPLQVNRRVVLGSLGVIPAAPVFAGPVQMNAGPRASAFDLVRLQGSTDPLVISPWWYEVAIYAVTAHGPPVLMLRAEGCETYAMRFAQDGSFRSHGATVTAFKHAVDNRWIDTFDNPITQKRNGIRPNIFTGTLFVYPADGSVPMPVTQAGVTTTGWVRWIESGAMTACMMERKSTGAWQPYMETTSIWTDRMQLLGTAATIVDATFSSTFLVPWSGWMEMGDIPGHLLWHSTGRKLRSLDDLPSRYRARAEELAPGVLARDPFA